MILKKTGRRSSVRSGRNRRNIEAVVLQQPKDQPEQFSGSESECAFTLVLVDLFIFKVIVAPMLRAATHKSFGSLTQVVFEKAVA